MMNCTQFQNRLDDFLDGTITGLPAEAAADHYAKCPDCRGSAEAQWRLRTMLRDLPVEPPSPGFTARALRQARHPARRTRSGFAAGFGSAAAIALLIWAVAGQVHGPATPDGSATVQLAVAEQRQVNLVFEVPVDIQGAELAMELPAHVELAGFPGKKSLSWRTDLAQGRNVLTLPLIGHASTDGELIARITYGGTEKQFRVRMLVGAPQVRQNSASHSRQA